MKHILFVDDDANFLDGLRRMLRGQRDVWEMRYAHSAADGLSAAQKTSFDVIVSDVSMPVKSGLELLAELRQGEKTRKTPVIMLTGGGDTDLKRRALDLGATDLLNKPVLIEDLLARLNSVIRLKEYQDELEKQNEILERKVQERTIELDRSRRDILLRLAKAGEFRDADTGDHVIRVACYSRILAEAIHLDGPTVEMIFLTSPLHDIGKIGIPDGILLKQGAFTSHERAIMEGHCEIGASILLEHPKGMETFLHFPTDADSEFTSSSEDALRDMAVTIALTHHERWDGTGYPRGLKGEEIPLAGRIVSIADQYDALRSERPYKPSFDQKATLEIMRQNAGTHLDPTLFAVCQAKSDSFEEILARYLQ